MVVKQVSKISQMYIYVQQYQKMFPRIPILSYKLYKLKTTEKKESKLKIK